MVSRRRVNWCDFRMDFSLVAGAVQLDNLLVNAPVSETLTITRIIGDFKVYQPPTTEVENLSIIDCGIGVINDEAFILGTGVGIPNPTVEDSYPPRGWLYVGTDSTWQQLPGGGSPTGISSLPGHFKFDIRGQRKVDKGVLFMWIEQNLVLGSASTLRFLGRIRVLFKT